MGSLLVSQKAYVMTDIFYSMERQNSIEISFVSLCLRWAIISPDRYFLSIGRAMLMKALLIYPEYPKTYWSFHYALKFISKKAGFPPLGLITIGAMLPGDW
jgi:hypothetical protein